MSARTFADATNKTKRLFAFPSSGGAPIKGKRVFIMDPVSGIARLIFSAEDDLSMLSGTAANGVGFIAGAFGTLTPNTLGDGAIVGQLEVGNLVSTTPRELLFAIQGYPGTINQNYLTSLTFLGATFAPGDANFTSFSGGGAGGSATWEWQNAPVPAVGSTIPIAVVRS